jgi:hypothetical protein
LDSDNNSKITPASTVQKATGDWARQTDQAENGNSRPGSGGSKQIKKNMQKGSSFKSDYSLNREDEVNEALSDQQTRKEKMSTFHKESQKKKTSELLLVAPAGAETTKNIPQSNLLQVNKSHTQVVQAQEDSVSSRESEYLDEDAPAVEEKPTMSLGETLLKLRKMKEEQDHAKKLQSRSMSLGGSSMEITIDKPNFGRHGTLKIQSPTLVPTRSDQGAVNGIYQHAPNSSLLPRGSGFGLMGNNH